MHRNEQADTTQQEELHLFVLDVLRHDAVEQAPSIVRLLNDNSGCIGWREFWPHDFSTTEVISSLIKLEQDGCVRALRETVEQDDLSPVARGQLEPSKLDDVWFALTEKGRRLLNDWRPPRS